MERIDPWGGLELKDYEHLFKSFGLQAFPGEWNRKLHHALFERSMVVAHRDFGSVLERIQSKKPFINMTGIASSGKLHLGHKADIDLFAFFKSQAHARNYFCIADIDGYVSRPDEKVASLEKAKEFAVGNLSHALALGLNEKDAYVQSQASPAYYAFAFSLSKKITANMHEAIYGHVEFGKIAANLLQMADILHGQLEEFEGPLPSITGIGLDQDPHARLARDLARRALPNGFLPSFIYFKHQGGLLEGQKMSSSKPDTAIYLDDSQEQIARKIQRAFTGGKPTAKEQREQGANPDICRVCEILRFHYPNTKKLYERLDAYRKGDILDGENKAFTIEFVQGMLKKHQELAAKKQKIAERMVHGS